MLIYKQAMAQTRPKTRLYTPQDLSAGRVIVFDRPQSAYLIKVMRLRPGAEVGLFNGEDGEWRAQLAIAGSRAVEAVIQTQLCLPEPKTGPTLAFVPLKKAPMEWLLTKATELGVARFQPLITDFGQAQALPKEDRLATLLQEAAEQCERCTVPEVRPPQHFGPWLEGAERVLAAVEAGEALDARAWMQAPGVVPDQLLIGPEGGFSGAELAALAGHPGVICLNLGARILRAETAGLSLLTLAQVASGEFMGRPSFRS